MYRASWYAIIPSCSVRRAMRTRSIPWFRRCTRVPRFSTRRSCIRATGRHGYFAAPRIWHAIYQDTEHFSNKDFAPFAKLLGDSWNLLPAETDPPMHALYRAMVNPLFAPRKMQAMDNRVREFARGYIAKFKDRGECEFMSELAFRFPIAVFLELMDLPLERIDEFLQWEMQLLHSADLEVIIDGVRKVKNYLMSVIEERREHPGEDFISYGIKAEIEGRKLTQDELFGFCFNLFIGGLDTVSTNMGLHFRHLAEHPDHQEILRKDPSKIPAAIEELLRAYAAVTTFRTVIKPVTVERRAADARRQGGHGDHARQSRSGGVRAAERGAARPQSAPHHLRHRPAPLCRRAALARRELVIAMEEFLGSMPSFRVKPGVTIRTGIGMMIEPETVPLVWKIYAKGASK